MIDRDSFPNDALEITAWTEDGLVMAARHKVYRHLQVTIRPEYLRVFFSSSILIYFGKMFKKLQGVQFHPESIISTEGKAIVHNFIKLVKRREAEANN